MSIRLENKIALVTGAGQGIGQAIAEKLAEDGAAVTLAEVNIETGQRAAHELRQRGFRALFAHTDITQEASVKAAVEQTVAHFGGLDILVNNAGTNFYFNAAEMTTEDWDKAMAVDLKGAWLCCKYAIPSMLLRGGGAIINIASVHSFMTAPGMFPYAVAKSGLVGMTRSLALDWGKQQIRVVAVSPGWVKTPLVEAHFERQPDPEQAEARVADVQPVGRIGMPRDIANLVAFLASHDASYITGTEIVIDGGISAKYAT